MSFLHTSLCAVLAFLVCAPVSSRPPSPGLFTHLLHSQLVHTPRFHTTPSHHTHTLSHTTLSSTTLSHTTFVSHTVGYWLVDFLSDVDIVAKCPESPSKSSTRKSANLKLWKPFCIYLNLTWRAKSISQNIIAVFVGCRTMTFPAAPCIMNVNPFVITLYAHTLSVCQTLTQNSFTHNF